MGKDWVGNDRIKSELGWILKVASATKKIKRSVWKCEVEQSTNMHDDKTFLEGFATESVTKCKKENEDYCALC